MPYSKHQPAFQRDSDELMQLQVRSGYVKNDFEWDNLKKLSFKVALLFCPINYISIGLLLANKLRCTELFKVSQL